MTRRRSNIYKLLTSVAIVAIMSISFIVPSLAAPDDNWSAGTPSKPAPSAITKIFKMPIDTDTPAAVFEFIFTAQGVDGGTNTTGMPPIGPITITYTIGDVGAHIFLDEDNNERLVVRESEDILKLIPPTSWPARGVYTYLIEETQSGIVLVDASKEKDHYSPANYYIKFYVEEDEDNDNALYVKYVNAVIITGTRDEYYDGKPGDGKIDPTPGEHWTVPYKEIEDGFSQLIFTNRYWKTDGPGTPEPGQAALEISKKVETSDTEGVAFDTYFTFNVTVTQPSVAVGDQEYKAYVIDSQGNVVTGDTNYSGTGAGGLITFKSEETLQIKLKHDEKLIFADLHIGALVEVEEVVNPQFRPRYQRTFSGNEVYTGKTTDSVWGFPRNADPVDNKPHYLPKGAGINKVNYTNIHTGATPTGLDVDDLPYIILIGLATIGLAGFVAIKSRKKNQA